MSLHSVSEGTNPFYGQLLTMNHKNSASREIIVCDDV